MSKTASRNRRFTECPFSSVGFSHFFATQPRCKQHRLMTCHSMAAGTGASGPHQNLLVQQQAHHHLMRNVCLPEHCSPCLLKHASARHPRHFTGEIHVRNP